ncbi:protein FAM171B-like [Gadus macrocephalus]|uniref:protein FAM171B-like n=1 Tax=Gadus macrocephalus TaxID=80720 RepID=UPI0028CB7C9B|nr:protein FAM171B-like [Gadus macrocephalus]
MHPFAFLLCILFFPRNARTDGGLVPNGRVSHLKEDNFSGHEQTDHPGQPQHQPNDGIRSSGGSSCTLKVQVSDLLSRQGLSQARVEVYLDYSQATVGLTGEDGVVLLPLPYQELVPNVVVVASKDGYVLMASPWKPQRMPIFSSITMSLLALSKGNIWLYEDFILINGKTSDALFQPSVEFPQSLLNLSSTSSNVSSLSAYFTAPVLKSGERDAPLRITAITSTKSGFTSGELRAVAAVSVQLTSREAELQVTGPLRMSLPLEPGWGLQPGDHVPAWLFNHTAGGWMRAGLGTVVSSRGKLTWTFMAPHLGYWIAAPLSSTRGSKDLSVAIDFLFQHCLSIMAGLGATLLVILLLLVALCYCSQSKSKVALVSNLPLSKRDQSTSTCENDLFLVSMRDSRLDQESQLNIPAAGQSNTYHRNDSAFYRENAMAVEMESPVEGYHTAAGHADHLTSHPNQLTSLPDHLTGFSQQLGASLSLDDSLFFYNQPMAILHAPAFFHVDQEHCRSYALPQHLPATNPPPVAAESTPQSAAPSLQNQPNAENPPEAQGSTDPSTSISPSVDPTASASGSSPRGHHLPESLSVPGTLNKVRDKRHSCSGPFPGPGLQGAGGDPSHLPPRAWFVSLDGKPAAEIHRAVSDQHRRPQRPVESRDTSLDSGVDMSELNPTAGRRAAVALERSVTFVKHGQQP